MHDACRVYIAVGDEEWMRETVWMIMQKAFSFYGVHSKVPTTLISDGARNFHQAWKSEYRQKNPLQKETEHIRHIHMKGDKNNNRMERLNGTIRDREVVYRGIKKMDSPLFDGFQTFYNFSKKHGGIDKKTPAEMAGILVDGNNKWKTIIQNAYLHRINQ